MYFVNVRENPHSYYLKPVGPGMSVATRGLSMPKARWVVSQDLSDILSDLLNRAYQAGYETKEAEVKKALGISS